MRRDMPPQRGPLKHGARTIGSEGMAAKPIRLLLIEEDAECAELLCALLAEAALLESEERFRIMFHNAHDRKRRAGSCP